MNRYLLELSKSTIKFLEKSDRITKERLINVIHALTENPYSYPGTTKLTGFDNTFRIRVGKYRIIYQIFDEKLLIFIQDIDSRGDIYKHLF
jgi:mRNA interferase RelE/StbE